MKVNIGMLGQTYLVQKLVEQAKFVGCKHNPKHGKARRASKNSADDP